MPWFSGWNGVPFPVPNFRHVFAEPVDSLLSSRVFAFRLSRILSLDGEAVAFGTVAKSRLRRRHVGRRALPGLQRRVLKRASEGKTQLPRDAARLADGVQPLRRSHIALPAGKKNYSGNRVRHRPAKTAQR